MDLSVIAKIKEHIQKHKTAYLCALTAVGVAGFTYHIMREPRAVLGNAGTDCPAMESTGSFSFARSIFGSATNNVVTTIHKGTKGNPGFVTRCVETNELFSTQGAAARTFNIPESVISDHLNGKFLDAKGYHFERLGVLNS